MTITIKQSADLETIKQVLSVPSIFSLMSDDFTTPVSEWAALRDDVLSFVAWQQNDAPAGVWLFVPDNAICWKAHFAVLPVMYGDPVFLASQEVIEAVWGMGCHRIIGEIPEYNRLSLQFVQKLGFSVFGVNEQSCMKNGRLWDQIMVGLSKPGAHKWVS